MENRANYTLVGGFVLGVMLVGLAFVVWLARFELKEDRTLYYIYFRGSVAGLAEGSTVRLRGVPVGTVSAIAIDAKNVELIEVTVAIKPGTPIKTDTIASLAAQGITGLAYINLMGGSNAAPPLVPREGKRRATIPSVPSPLEKLFDEAPNVIANASAVAAQTAQLLSEENIARISRILGHVETLSGSLAAQRDQIAPLAGEARVAIETVQWLALDARDALGRLERELAVTLGDTRTLVRDTDRLVTGLQPAAGDVRQGAQNVARMTTELETALRGSGGPLRGFIDGGLYEFSQFVTEARQLVASLQRLSLQMERDPARFLFGDQTRGFEPSHQEQRP
jgi:phospholipid/cholesterol/gamma-HCH transport system substrate-binding protein